MSKTQSLESVPFAVLVVANDGLISSGNASAHRMLAQPTGALLGRPANEIFVEGLEHVYAVFQAGEAARFEARMLKADGRVLSVSLAVEPTHRDGSPISSVTVVCKPLPPWASIPPARPLS